ncbi:Transmembrane protein 69 [Blyttiomyces sp. JEL0837]|nr:Transmembrane protein 69 [Blyttiomyces sp. JEL0837]
MLLALNTARRCLSARQCLMFHSSAPHSTFRAASSSLYALSLKPSSLALSATNVPRRHLTIPPPPSSSSSSSSGTNESQLSSTPTQQSSQVSFSLAPTPLVPKLLGFAGLIPFVSTAGLTIMYPEFAGLMMEVQAIYSSCILSFMGAVHWGLAMADYGDPSTNTRRYILSTAPSLLAFGSLVVLNTPTALLAQLVGFNALVYADVSAAYTRLVPAWYPGLRVLLTSVVTVSVGTTVYVAYRFGEQPVSK